jgi:outer membrane protease
MKKRVAMLWVAWLLPAAGWAAFQAMPIAGPKDGPAIPFAAQASMGLLNGDAVEHVFGYYNMSPAEVFYLDLTSGTRYQISRLDWELKNVVMGGGSLSVRPLGKLTLNAGLWLALSKGGGEMEDYDWLGPLYGVPAEVNTHYSLSDVDVTEGYILDLNAAWDVYQRDNLTVRVAAGYKQNGWTWEDRIRYMVYIDDYFIPDFSHAGDNGINYEQEFRIPYLGANADWAWNQFTFSGYLTWSPLVAATDWDEHVLTGVNYTESFEGGDLIGFGVEARYEFSAGTFSGAFVTAALDYQAIDLIVGDMELYDTTTGESAAARNAAGIENEYLVISLGGGIRF